MFTHESMELVIYLTFLKLASKEFKLMFPGLISLKVRRGDAIRGEVNYGLMLLFLCRCDEDADCGCEISRGECRDADFGEFGGVDSTI